MTPPKNIYIWYGRHAQIVLKIKCSVKRHLNGHQTKQFKKNICFIGNSKTCQYNHLSNKRVKRIGFGGKIQIL